jgi:hypothetical protein
VIDRLWSLVFEDPAMPPSSPGSQAGGNRHGG